MHVYACMCVYVCMGVWVYLYVEMILRSACLKSEHKWSSRVAMKFCSFGRSWTSVVSPCFCQSTYMKNRTNCANKTCDQYTIAVCICVCHVTLTSGLVTLRAVTVTVLFYGINLLKHQHRIADAELVGCCLNQKSPHPHWACPKGPSD